MFIDERVIDLKSSCNFAITKGVKRKPNPIVDLSKFAYYKKIFNTVTLFIVTLCKLNSTLYIYIYIKSIKDWIIHQSHYWTHKEMIPINLGI